MEQPDRGEQRLQRWIGYVLSLATDRFLPITQLGQLLFEPLHESNAAASLFLNESVDPHRAAIKVNWQAHAAASGGIDLLRADYTVAGLDLRLWEGRNFVLVEARQHVLSYAQAPDGQAYLRGLINAVVKLKSQLHDWTITVPASAELAKVQRLNNVGAPPISSVSSRHDRVDVLIVSGSVLFMFYKKIEQLIGFQADDSWFSPEARAAIQQRLSAPR